MTFISTLNKALLLAWVSFASVSANALAKDVGLPKAVTVNSTESTNTYEEAINYGRSNPTRDGGSWAGWCAALMVRAGNLPDWAIRPTAISAYYSSTIISYDTMAAPSGAFHFWDVGEDGHVAMATDHGWAMMASCRVTEMWGDCIGNTDVASYTAAIGATYLGWSFDYAGAEIADVHKRVYSPLSEMKGLLPVKTDIKVTEEKVPGP